MVFSLKYHLEFLSNNDFLASKMGFSLRKSPFFRKSSRFLEKSQGILVNSKFFSPKNGVFLSKIPFSCTKVAFLVNLRHQYWFYYNKGVKCVCPFLTPLGIMGQPPVSIILIFIISLYFRCFRAISIFRQFSTIFFDNFRK